MNNMLQTRRPDLVDELQEAGLHARYCGLSVSIKELLLLASLFLLELSIMLMPMAIYMKGERSFAIFLTSKPGMVFQGAIVLLFTVGAFIGYQYWVSKRSRSSHFRLIVMMNLVTVTLILVAAELTVRFSSQSSKEGETFGNTVLLPKNWQKVALHYRELLDKASGVISVLVYDELLGWTVGPNIRSADGLYYSSSEGIRAPHAGIKFADRPAKKRIALVGDSFTFGQEVTYEDTWGHHLEKALGSEFQVLNFGVPGYGVDQAYLRYEKDVRRWNPEIIIFSFINHDLVRTMSVYSFIAFPKSVLPFSTPRFVLSDGTLERINVPPLAPEAIFSRESISDLPFLEYQSDYDHWQWEKSLSHLPYLARLFVSRFPRWSHQNPQVSEEALVTLNATILQNFVRTARQAQATPIVVYLPSGNELKSTTQGSLAPISKQVLEEASIGYTDLRPCLMDLDPADRLAPDATHYSPQANAKIANCVYDVVNEKVGANEHQAVNDECCNG
jgi:hypothetical protein